MVIVTKESKGSSSSLAGCQPGALEVVGSNPTDPIIFMMMLLLNHGHASSDIEHKYSKCSLKVKEH